MPLVYGPPAPTVHRTEVARARLHDATARRTDDRLCVVILYEWI